MSELRGLDSWIEGDNVCSYCGMYSCVCEKEDDGEPEDVCMFCGEPIPIKTTSGRKLRVKESFTSVLFWTYGRRVAMRALKNPAFRSGDKVRVTVELVRRAKPDER